MSRDSLVEGLHRHWKAAIHHHGLDSSSRPAVVDAPAALTVRSMSLILCGVRAGGQRCCLANASSH